MEGPRSCKTIDEMAVGDRVERSYVITDQDVATFGALSGDYNPVHFDADYAAGTVFRRRIAHGMISVAKFSGIFGMDMPGLGTLWLSQKVTFEGPVFIGEPYKAVAQVVGLQGRRATIETWVEDKDGKRVINGEGIVIPISEAARAKLRHRG